MITSPNPLYIMELPLSDLLQYLTFGGLLTIIVVGSRFYGTLKRDIVQDTEFKNLVKKNENEISRLHERISQLKKEHTVRMKEIVDRVDSDKNAILTKFEEMDNKFEGRFNKLTELIIDLFKK